MSSNRREILIVVFVLFLVFVVFLPQFIDYGRVVDAMLQLTIGQMMLLSILGLLESVFDARPVHAEDAPGARPHPENAK